MKGLCIYPADETTEFLRPIYEALSALPSFIGIELTTDNKNIEQAIKAINSCDENAHILFLGHGASHCLYKIDRTPFIGSGEFQMFQNKRIFLFACRSADFIKKNSAIIPKEYIGFGNMLTDLSEVIAERDADASAYLGIDETIISKYKEILIETISESLKRTIGLAEDYNSLYLRIKLSFNKRIANLLTEKTFSGYRILANLLYETKTEMIIG